MKASTASRRDLLKLPHIGYREEGGWYGSLLIVPSRKMHDSGYTLIAIIGVDADGEAEHILAMPDDIQWPANSAISDSPSLHDYGDLRTDCYWPSGVLHLWSGGYEFSIPRAGSSAEIKIRRRVAK